MLRWKKDKQETGLRLITIGAGLPSFWYHDGVKRYAWVSSAGKNKWYWVAGWNSDIPYKNTCYEPCSTIQEAKKQAQEYVKEHISNKGD